MREINVDALFSKFNVYFIAIALTFFVFSWSIFPLIWYEGKRSGSTLSDAFFFFGSLCGAVEKNPLLYFLGCVIYYAISLRFFKAGANALINTGTLLCVAVLMLFLGGPFSGLGD